MLTLIEDSTVALKMATLICACVVLLAFESEIFISKFSKKLFYFAIFMPSTIWLIFVYLAFASIIEREQIRDRLELLYIKAPLPTSIKLSDANVLDHTSVIDFSEKVESWVKDVANYLDGNLRPAAKARFLDDSDHMTLNYGYPDKEFNGAMNEMTQRKKNLKSIIESKVYEK